MQVADNFLHDASSNIETLIFCSQTLRSKVVWLFKWNRRDRDFFCGGNLFVLFFVGVNLNVFLIVITLSVQ